MTNRRSSFSDFIDRIKDKDYHEIIQVAEEEANSVERISYRIKGAVRNRQMGSTSYAEELKEFLFFMRYGKKPFSINEWNWDLYRIVVDKFVEKGQFKQSIYDVFNN